MAAPFTSIGYDGSVDETQWAKLIPQAGGRLYSVADETSWRATVTPNVDREITLSTGIGSAHGITDITDAPVTLPIFDTQASGTRYDLVVARRTWSSNTTSFAIVKGGSQPALPTRNTTPGTVDDQPLWLVPVVANGAGGALGTPIDVRVWQGDGGMLARHELVLTYMTRVGTQVRIGDTVWQRTLNSSNTPTWVRSSLSSIPLLGNSDALSNLPGLGAPAPVGSDFKIQAGTQRNIANSSAFARLTFPVPFPNGLLSVILTNADDAAAQSLTFSICGSPLPGYPFGFGDRTSVYYRVWGVSGDGPYDYWVHPGLAHRVSYIAIGW